MQRIVSRRSFPLSPNSVSFRFRFLRGREKIWAAEGGPLVVPVDLSEKSSSNSWSAPMRSQKLNELNHELNWTSERNSATNAQSLARAQPSA